jgi:hypothetical protein
MNTPEQSNAMFEAMKSKKVLAVCLPLYDGTLHWETWFKLRDEERIFEALGLPWRIEPVVVAGCSAIHVARNDLVFHALERGAEAIMWLDGDMNWSEGAIARLLLSGRDFIGAAVPRKEVPLAWNVRPLNDDWDAAVVEDNGHIEVATIGTGFLFTAKAVYDRLAEKLGREYHYLGREDGKVRVAYFECPLSFGEDTRFCYQWRNLCGGKVYVDPDIGMSHIIAPRWNVTGQLREWLAERTAEKARAEERAA